MHHLNLLQRFDEALYWNESLAFLLSNLIEVCRIFFWVGVIKISFQPISPYEFTKQFTFVTSCLRK